MLTNVLLLLKLPLDVIENLLSMRIIKETGKLRCNANSIELAMIYSSPI